MTAVNRKILKKADKSKKNLKGINLPPLVLCFFISICASRATWSDIPLPALALILIAACEDIMMKAVLSAGSTLAFILLSVQNSAFIPYLLANIAYIAGYTLFRNQKYPVVLSIAFLTFSKILLVRSKQPWQYSIYTILESAAVYLMITVLKNGEEIYTSYRTDMTFTDGVCLLLSGLTITLSFSGMDSHRLYVGSAVSLSLSWLYIQNCRLNYSLLALICFCFSLSDKQGFAPLFICGLAVWLSGALCAEKSSPVIYPLTVFTAFTGNLIFLPTLNSFGLLGTTLGALLVYTALPYAMKFNTMKKPDTFSQEKDYRQLLISMKKLEESLNFLGNCAIDISRLNEKNLRTQTLEDAVAEDICRKCEYNSHCWQEKYSFTSQQFSKYAKSIHWAAERGFDMGFYSQCRQIEKLKTSFEENSRLLLSRKYILQSQKNNQKLLQNAFMSISATVGDMLYQNRTSRLVNSALTMQLDNFLETLDIKHTYCLCSQNPDRANFAVVSPLSESDLYKIKNKLEHLYSEKFSDGDFEKQGNEFIYNFYAKPVFTYEYKAESSAFRQVNGDAYLVLQLEGKLYILLSDGMGTGAAAAAESRTVLAMAKSLLSCGVSITNMLNIINLSLNLRGSGENGASLDVLCIDLFTGKAILTKAGAGVSIVLNESNMTRYYKDSLPLGVLKDVKYSTDEFTINTKDTVVLMSDGVGNVSANIRNLYSQSCEEIAHFAITENKTLDDKTVIALRLKIL